MNWPTEDRFSVFAERTHSRETNAGQPTSSAGRFLEVVDPTSEIRDLTALRLRFSRWQSWQIGSERINQGN